MKCISSLTQILQPMQKETRRDRVFCLKLAAIIDPAGIHTEESVTTILSLTIFRYQIM